MPGEQPWELTSAGLHGLDKWARGRGAWRWTHFLIESTLEAEQVCGNVLSVWAWRCLSHYSATLGCWMGGDVEPEIRRCSQKVEAKWGGNCPGTKKSVEEGLELGISMLDIECLVIEEANRCLRNPRKRVGFQMVHRPKEEESWDLRVMVIHISAMRSPWLLWELLRCGGGGLVC